MSKDTAKNMRWHKDEQHDDNALRHPANSIVWREFDKEHDWFAQDSRNVRLGLTSDGFNSFCNMSTSYSMWPVVLMPYNLPPWKCMKVPHIMLSLLIPGPTAPGNEIDVYLRPLVDDLHELWNEGVITYDALTQQTFKLHAALLWTVVQIIILASARIVCNIAFCMCEVDPTGNCVAKINLYSN
jgi:hypothetical protein